MRAQSAEAGAQSSTLDVGYAGGRITVRYAQSGSYNIEITEELDSALHPLLERVAVGTDCSTAFIVIDPNACERIRAQGLTEEVLGGLGIPVLGNVEVGGGETDKSMATVERLWKEWHRHHLLRRTLIVAIGGGVTCDAVGFAAATYLRGIPYVLVPSTLMAQIDAAIGGKVGVDFAGTKNVIGTFAQPHGVAVAIEFLPLLPRRIWANGVAEALKVAVAGSPRLFALLATDYDELQRADPEWLRDIVVTSIREKLRHLTADPFEVNDLHRVLNLGHCIGHAVEAAADFTWLHGECVAVGLAVAARVSVAAGYALPETAALIEEALEVHRLPAHVPPVLRRRAWDELRRISNVRNGALNLVVPVEIGRTEILDEWPSEVEWADVA